MHRPWSTLRHPCHGGIEGGAEVGWVQDPKALQKQRICKSRLIGQFMEMALMFAQTVRSVGAGNHQHRDAVCAGLCHTGRGICQTRSGDQQAYARLAGHTGVAIGHERGPLLMAGRYVADRTLIEAPIEFDRMNAGNAEHVFDTSLFKQIHKSFAYSQSRHGDASSSKLRVMVRRVVAPSQVQSVFD